MTSGKSNKPKKEMNQYNYKKNTQHQEINSPNMHERLKIVIYQPPREMQWLCDGIH
jgi:hypothetical protein